MSSSSISIEWLDYNLKPLLMNRMYAYAFIVHSIEYINIFIAFLSPEFRNFLRNDSFSSKQNIDYQFSEFDDVYSFGILIYMMVTLTYDSDSMFNFLKAPSSRSFEAYLAEQLKSLFSSEKYSQRIINLIVRALHPNIKQRATVKQLMTLLTVKEVQTLEFSFKFEDEFNILKEISYSSLTALQGIDNYIKMDDLTFDILNKQYSSSIYLVEEKNTLKRYNTYCMSFSNEKNALQYYEDNCKLQGSLKHENLVLIYRIFYENSNSNQFRVYLVKVRLILLKCKHVNNNS
jgi:serine/threonine protein kinase